jgi:hypothetical protein
MPPSVQSSSRVDPFPYHHAADHYLQSPLPDEDLDVARHNWRAALAYGVKFAEVQLPLAGRPPPVDGDRYYAHKGNALYQDIRVLKLHSSIGWLESTGRPFHPVKELEFMLGEPPKGIVLDENTSYWLAEPPERRGWLMEPLLIPPHLHKSYERMASRSRELV